MPTPTELRPDPGCLQGWDPWVLRGRKLRWLQGRVSHIWPFSHPVDCSPPGSSVHGISQARTLEWVAIPFAGGSSRPGMEPSTGPASPALVGRFSTADWAMRQSTTRQTTFPHGQIYLLSVCPFHVTQKKVPLANLRHQEGRAISPVTLNSVHVCLRKQVRKETPSIACGPCSQEPPCSVGRLGSVPGLGRSPGEGNGNPLQGSCLVNFMNRAAWRATVHGVTKTWTRLSDWISSHFTHTLTLLFNFAAS